MSKELFIASSPHETKVAVLEDDELVEVFYQRDTDAGLVGGIYKGRVSRVLPGMQSAFVDIGLERDAFLYVSDFFEDSEEYERVLADAEARVAKQAVAAAQPPGVDASTGGGAAAAGEAEGRAAVPAPAPAPETIAPGPPEVASPPPTSPPPPPFARGSEAGSGYRRPEPRGRRRRRRGGRGFSERPEFREQRPPETGPGFQVLPGESLAKYGRGEAGEATPAGAESAPQASEETAPAPPEVRTLSVEVGAVSEERPEFSREALPQEQVSITEESTVVSVEPEQGSEESATTEVPGSPSEPAEEASSAADERLETELLEGNLRMAPVDFEPDAPVHHPLEGAEGGPVESVVREAAETPSETVAGEASEPGPDSAAAPPTGVRGEESAIAGTTAESAGEESEEFSPPPTGMTGIPEGGSQRAYTVRESHQRPRFAPRRGRRGRGRFGHRGPRPEGPRRRDFPRGGNEQPVQINEVLKEGQEILVQIAKEPLGTKGARITSHIALPGRYLVYMPTIQHIGVSRKIASEEERLRLRNIVLENRGTLIGGIIARTAAAGRSEEELKGDLQFLSTLWNGIRSRTEQAKAPALIHRDLTLVERILRDILSPDFKCVRVDNEVEYQNILEFVHRFQPSLIGHVRLHTKDTPLFEEFGIQAEIDKALKPKVWLKSGGYIVINQTEALVAIDVNTGKYVGKTSRLEDTIVKTNIDAVKEIVRQIRLRDLGGIVVIDFIDMDDRRNRMKVVQALEEALRGDRAPTKILSFNEFGLVALTRKRVKQSLERTLCEPCAYCLGSGWIKSVTTVCYEIMEEARKMAHEIEGKVLTLRVHPEVARALKSREGALTSELESITGKDVVIKSDPTVHQERFEIF